VNGEDYEVLAGLFGMMVEVRATGYRSGPQRRYQCVNTGLGVMSRIKVDGWSVGSPAPDAQWRGDGVRGCGALWQ
jgi:hypothetical protein